MRQTPASTGSARRSVEDMSAAVRRGGLESIVKQVMPGIGVDKGCQEWLEYMRPKDVQMSLAQVCTYSAHIY